MKTVSKHSKVQAVETRVRKNPIPQENIIASRTFRQPGFYSVSAAETIYRTSLPSADIKLLHYFEQKTFSKSAAKPYRPQAGILKTSKEAWFLESIRTLEELGNLPTNWDSYGANPPNSTALVWGRTVLEVLLNMNFPPTRILPSVEEGVGICFISGKKYADIECFNTGEIVAVTSDGQGNPNVWEVNPDRKELKNSLDRIRVYLQS